MPFPMPFPMPLPEVPGRVDGDLDEQSALFQDVSFRLGDDADAS